MKEDERFVNAYDGNNIVEILALYLTGKLKKEDMDEDNQAILRFYLGSMEEDPKFKNRVNTRKNEILSNIKDGVRKSMFTEAQLKKAKSHRKKKITSYEKAFQPLLFDDRIENVRTVESGMILDPERGIAQMHEFQNRFSKYRKPYLSEEVRLKKNQLRNLVGLPIARGKDPHVNDPFYQTLVKDIFANDVFHIVTEFDSAIIGPSEELDQKINQIKRFVSEVDRPELGLKHKYEQFNQFKENFFNNPEE